MIHVAFRPATTLSGCGLLHLPYQRRETTRSKVSRIVLCPRTVGPGLATTAPPIRGRGSQKRQFWRRESFARYPTALPCPPKRTYRHEMNMDCKTACLMAMQNAVYQAMFGWNNGDQHLDDLISLSIAPTKMLTRSLFGTNVANGSGISP